MGVLETVSVGEPVLRSPAHAGADDELVARWGF